MAEKKGSPATAVLLIILIIVVVAVGWWYVSKRGATTVAKPPGGGNPLVETPESEKPSMPGQPPATPANRGKVTPEKPAGK